MAGRVGRRSERTRSPCVSRSDIWDFGRSKSSWRSVTHAGGAFGVERLVPWMRRHRPWITIALWSSVVTTFATVDIRTSWLRSRLLTALADRFWTGSARTPCRLACPSEQLSGGLGRAHSLRHDVAVFQFLAIQRGVAMQIFAQRGPFQGDASTQPLRICLKAAHPLPLLFRQDRYPNPAFPANAERRGLEVRDNHDAMGVLE